MPGKTTLHALSFDPSKFQFLAKFSCFPMSSKQERCVRRYGISTVTYTRSVCRLPEGKSRTVCDLSKGQPHTLREVEKYYVGSKNQFFI